MSTHKNIDKICVVAVLLSLIISLVLMNGDRLGIHGTPKTMGYESRLFDTSRVHTIDLVMDGWENFIETCENEEYAACAAVIDGEAYKNIGIRAKGNTSLSSVASSGSDRYSFKIEFDQYETGKTYHGLDKLSLNNIIQDNTFMKDYLVYQMMGQFDVAAPLCSYAYITVNGEDWGLYLAVEGVEDSFLQRNYGSDYGELYKPDSMSFGAGRGNGRDFDMEEFQNSQENSGNISENIEMPERMEIPGGMMMPGGMDMLEGMGIPEGTDISNVPGGKMDFSQMTPLEENGTIPENAQMISPDENNMTSEANNEESENSEINSNANRSRGNRQFDMGNMPGDAGGRGSSDVKLQYIDENPDSYSNIFDNAKTEVNEADQERLIDSLEKLSNGEDLEKVVDIESVIRYFVVHNFVCNADSYTGMMIHNYYLHEENGQLSMIPWDYNLAFGGFQGSSDPSGTVNEAIDSPVSNGSMEDRPMLAWIFENEEYTERYHEIFAEFIEMYFNSGYFEEIIEGVKEMISPYVEKDPSKFCTFEAFETGIDTLKEFCLLRAESVKGQLDGTIPSTTDAQRENPNNLVDASEISISAMGNGLGGGKMSMPGNAGGRMGVPGMNETGERANFQK